MANVEGFSQKTQTVVKQCLDSIVCPENKKNVFSYDNKGNNVLSVKPTIKKQLNYMEKM